MKPEILILVETQLTGKCCPKIQGYGKVVTRNRQTKGGGILIAVRKETAIDIITLHIDNTNEQIWTKVTTPGGNFILAVVYGLHEGKATDDEIENWHYEFEKQYCKYADEPVIVIGDMNAHIGNDEEGVEGNHQRINKNGRKWRDIIDRRNLTLVNSMETCVGKWTRTDKRNNTNSIIDLVIVNEEMQGKITGMRIDEEKKLSLARYTKKNGKTQEILSDHNCIITEVKGKPGNNKTRVTRWNFKNEESINKYKIETEKIIMKEKWLTPGDPEKKYKTWHTQFKSILYKCFHRVTNKSKMYTSKTTTLIKKKRALKHKLKRLQKHGINESFATQVLKAKMQEKTEEIANSISEEKSEKLKKRLESIMEKGNDRTNEIWKIRKRALHTDEQRIAVKDKNGAILTNKDNILNRYSEYYEELLKPRPITPENEQVTKQIEEQFKECLKSRNHESDEINKPFTMIELDKQLKTLKNNKSSGPDEIINEILKIAGKNLKQSILNLLNWIHKYEMLPNSLLELDIKTIYKGKGSISDMANHRGIFIGNTILKLLEKLINGRTTPIIEREGFSEAQAGGRRNRNITDHIFILRAIMQHYRYLNKPLYIEFLDLVKAFDKMLLKNIMTDLWKCKVRGKMWRLIYAINKQATIRIKTTFGKTAPTKIGETLKQGSVLASTLAAMHTDQVNNHFEHTGLGVHYGKVQIGNLIFQDDIARVEDSKENLNAANRRFNCFRVQNRMEFHPTKSMWMSTKKTNEDVLLSKTTINQTQEYKYLGEIITSDGKINETILQRKNSITGITAELNAITDQLRNSQIHIDAVLQYHNHIIIPRLLLNCETWINLTKQNSTELEKIQNSSLKRLLRLPQSTPSIGLRNELNIPSIENQILKKQLMYLHRVLNLPPNNITRKVLLEQQTMPGNTWLSDIQIKIQKLGLGIGTIEKIGELSKIEWKKLTTEAIFSKEKTERSEWMQHSTKCKNLQLTEKIIPPYIHELNPEDSWILLKTRIGMINLKTNYKNSTSDEKCPLCSMEPDNLEHLFACKKLPQSKIYSNTKMYSNAISDTPYLANLAKVINQKLKIREKMIKEKEDQSSTAMGVAEPSR